MRALFVLLLRRLPGDGGAVGMVAIVKVGEKSLVAFDASRLPTAEFESRNAAFKQQLAAFLKDAGYPTSADPDSIDYGTVFVLLFILSVLGVMTYGPIAAWLARPSATPLARKCASGSISAAATSGLRSR